MPFSLELRNDEVFKILKNIEGCSILPLEFGPNGLNVDVGTDAKSAAYSIYFPVSYFDNYEFFGEDPEIYPLGNSNFTNMLEMLRAVPYPVLMESTLDGVIKISNADAGKHFRIKCLEGEYKEYMYRIRNKFASTVSDSNAIITSIETSELKKALKDLGIVSLNVDITVDGNELELAAEGLEMEGNIILQLGKEISSEWKDKYSVNLLSTGLKLFSSVDWIVLFLGNTFTFTADKDNWYCRYVAAPQKGR